MQYNAPNWVNNGSPAINAANLQAISDTLEQDGQEIQTLQTQLANPFNYKGVVAAVENLPSSGNTINDTYYVTAATCLYTWNGSAWSVSSLSESDYLDILQQVLNDIAETYNSSSTYAVGDYCIYNNSLYRCTTAITTAEAFTVGHWTAVNVTGEVSDLKSALEQNEAATYIVPRMNLSTTGGDYPIEQGGIYPSNGTLQPESADVYTKRARMPGYVSLRAPSCLMIAPDGYATYVYRYQIIDDSYSFVDAAGWGPSQRVITPLDGAQTAIRISFAHTDFDTEITADDIAAIQAGLKIYYPANQAEDVAADAIMTLGNAAMRPSTITVGKGFDGNGAGKNDSTKCRLSKVLDGDAVLTVPSAYDYRLFAYNSTVASSSQYLVRELTRGWANGVPMVIPYDREDGILRVGVMFRLAEYPEHVMTETDAAALYSGVRWDYPSLVDYYTHPASYTSEVIYTDSTYNNAQGLCTDTNGKIYIACRTGGDTASADAAPTVLRRIADDGTLEASNGDTSYCHANGMTYYDGELYIATLGRPANVTADSPETDPQRLNVIGVANATTLANESFFSLRDQMLTLGPVYGAVSAVGVGTALECPYIAAVHYAANKDLFLALVAPHYLSQDKAVKYRGIAVFDKSWHLLDYFRFRDRVSGLHLGGITSDSDYIYVTDNVSNSATKKLLIFTWAFDFVGAADLVAGGTSELECGDFISDDLFCCINTSPITVSKFSLDYRTSTPLKAVLANRHDITL